MSDDLRKTAERVVAARRGSPEMYAAIRDLGIVLGVVQYPSKPREEWVKIGRRAALAANRYAGPLRIAMPESGQAGKLFVPSAKPEAVVGQIMRGSSNAWRAYQAGDRSALTAMRDLQKLGRKIARPIAADKKAAHANRHPFAGAALSMHVDDLGLDTRSANAFMFAGISTVGDLVAFDESTLLRIKNFGSKSLSDVKEHLAKMGLSLASRMENPPRWVR